MGVVDVPGHEKFVRQMVAGATGIDVVLLVVAADDGVMPQTREHLAIIDLLGIERGVVAITKSDLADEEWLDIVRADVDELLAGTSIEGAPVVAVSARTRRRAARAARDARRGRGRDDGAPRRPAHAPARRPRLHDRRRGHRRDRDDVVGLGEARRRGRDLPRGRARPHPQRAGAQRGRSTRRTPASASRSTSPASSVTTSRAATSSPRPARSPSPTASTRASPTSGTPGDDKPFESGARVHVNHGTREVLGRVLLMDAERLLPGQSGLAQVRLEEPLAPRYDDRFIVRSYSPVYTIGGGVVLDALPPRRTQLRAHERELLEALLAHDLSSAATGLLASRGVPMTSAQVAAALGVTRGVVADELNRAKLERLKVAQRDVLRHARGARGARRGDRARAARVPRGEPRAPPASPRARCATVVDRRIEPKVFDAVLALAAERGVAAVDGGLVRHPKAAVSALGAEADAEAALLPLIESQGLAPASVAELAREAGVDIGVARKVLGKLASRRARRAREQRAALLGGGDGAGEAPRRRVARRASRRGDRGGAARRARREPQVRDPAARVLRRAGVHEARRRRAGATESLAARLGAGDSAAARW